MINIHLHKIVLCFFGIVLFYACQKPDEELPRIIRITNAGEDETHSLMAQAGTLLSIDVLASDNKNLKQLKVELKSPNTVHQHSTQLTAFQQPNLGQWDTLIIVNSSGQQASHTFNFSVPDHIIGGWRLIASALDEDGNIYTTERYVHVANSQLPYFNISNTSPQVGTDGKVELNVNEPFLVTGQVIDLDTLDFVSAQITQNSSVMWQQQWNGVDSWSFDLSQITFPLFESSGSYTIRLSAQDLAGRSNYVTASIRVP